MEKIKSVRIRNVDAGVDERLSASLDVKIDLFIDNDTYIVKVNSNEYKYLITSDRYIDWSEDDFINEVVYDLVKENNIHYDIIQDPWQDEPPLERKYGYDPYYLNNNSILFVYWIDANNDNKGGLSWSDDKGNEKNELTNIIKSDYRKIVIIKHDDNNYYIYTEKGFVILYEKVNISKLIEQNIYFYNGSIKDLDVINDIINKWKNEVPNYKLDLCSPNHISCNIIEFISPIKEIRESENQHIPDEKEDNEIPKESETKKETILIIRDEEKKIKVKEDYKIELYVGDAKKQKELEIAKNEGLLEDEGFIFEADDNLEGLGSEYIEGDFEGLSEQEMLLQEEIMEGQMDSDSNLGLPDLTPPKNIPSKFSNLDDILKIAGSKARILGKNSRVNYNNLKIGYKKGVHGLCPQGTQAVLVAMTNINELGKISGNADWFSFKNPATGGSPWGVNKGFDKLINGKSYYNYKVRVNKSYFNDSKQWQIGDIIVCGYKGGKKYGHIQIWTGFYWMSDFKQNKIQQNNVDFSTVALWRMNDNGLNAIKNQRN